MAGLVVVAPVWHRRAACRGQTELFYSARYDDEQRAIAVCLDCPVRRECLDEALREEHVCRRYVFGVRGGMTPAERVAVSSYRKWLAKW